MIGFGNGFDYGGEQPTIGPRRIIPIDARGLPQPYGHVDPHGPVIPDTFGTGDPAWAPASPWYDLDETNLRAPSGDASRPFVCVEADPALRLLAVPGVPAGKYDPAMALEFCGGMNTSGIQLLGDDDEEDDGWSISRLWGGVKILAKKRVKELEDHPVDWLFFGSPGPRQIVEFLKACAEREAKKREEDPWRIVPGYSQFVDAWEVCENFDRGLGILAKDRGRGILASRLKRELEKRISPRSDEEAAEGIEEGIEFLVGATLYIWSRGRLRIKGGSKADDAAKKYFGRYRKVGSGSSGVPPPSAAPSVTKKLRGTLASDFKTALSEIESGAHRPNVRKPKPFDNDARGGTAKLPDFDGNGKKITYTEHTVNPRQPGGPLDGKRIVIGSNGAIYITDDHFVTWQLVVDFSTP